MDVVLLELGVFPPRAGEPGLWYAASRRYDPPLAPTACEERMLDQSCLDRTAQGVLGRIVLGNLDGRLDWLAEVAVVGQPLRLLRGAASSAYRSFVPVLATTVCGIRLAIDEVGLTFRLPAGQADALGLPPLGGAACDGLQVCQSHLNLVTLQVSASLHGPAKRQPAAMPGRAVRPAPPPPPPP